MSKNLTLYRNGKAMKNLSLISSHINLYFWNNAADESCLQGFIFFVFYVFFVVSNVWLVYGIEYQPKITVVLIKTVILPLELKI